MHNKLDLDKEQVVGYLEKASTFLIGLLFILFPVLFTNLTTDLFIIPKQALLIFTVISILIIYGIKNFIAEKVRIKRSPFDLPILLLIAAVLLSVVFSIARIDSIINFIPFVFAALSFFAVSFNIRDQKSLHALIACLLIGGAIVSLISILNFLKIYPFTFEFAKVQTFTPLGSVLDLATYLGILLPFALFYLFPFVKKGPKSISSLHKHDLARFVIVGIASIFIAIGFIISIFMLIRLQQPIILPLNTGLQVALAAVSQDATRILQGFLFGSGYGEFAISFMRFKQAIFNTNETLWSLTFFRSSSFVLEILATTGLLGILSFLLLCYRIVREKPLFIPLILLIAAAFVIPFGFYHLVLLFFMLGIYAGAKSLSEDSKFFEVELQIVASKKGFITLSSEEPTKAQEKYAKTLSAIVLVVIAIFSSIFGFLAFNYFSGNITFQKSLVAASQNNGTDTYNLQSQALNSFTGRYVDSYYRVFSQTNLALANSLATSVPQGSSPSAQVTQQIYTLVQQSINSARQATTLSPANSLNWQNLSSIYRALIGFGQNADQFAVLAAQQAAALDSTNPQQYVNLGGLFYQLGLWDRAIEQFTTAINLKQDYANAYYNLAYAFIQKGDLSNGLTQLQAVRSLIGDNKEALDKVNKEIQEVESKISQNQQPSTNNTNAPGLDTNNQQPATALPTQNPPVEIEGPNGPTPTPTETENQPSPTPTPSQPAP